MFIFNTTERFNKSLSKLSIYERKILTSKLKVFSINPLHPSLRTKKIKGIDKVFELSINMDIRVLWKYLGTDNVLLVDIGHHKDVLGI